MTPTLAADVLRSPDPAVRRLRLQRAVRFLALILDTDDGLEELSVTGLREFATYCADHDLPDEAARIRRWLP